MVPEDPLSLADYRGRVHAMYSRVQTADRPEAAWRQWTAARNELFASHVQSPLEAAHRSAFTELDYFPYVASMRTVAQLDTNIASPLDIPHSAAGSTRFIPIGSVSLADLGIDGRLTVYWLDSYGGGLFLPFRDATAGSTTYGGGRYLLDTVKGADLGVCNGRLVLDFNYAYNPSCAYSSRWSCPLAPPANRLATAIEAGERVPNLSAQPIAKSATEAMPNANPAS